MKGRCLSLLKNNSNQQGKVCISSEDWKDRSYSYQQGKRGCLSCYFNKGRKGEGKKLPLSFFVCQGTVSSLGRYGKLSLQTEEEGSRSFRQQRKASVFV